MWDPLTEYDPIEIGDRWLIVPPGFEGERDGRIPLVMRRGAFGSGQHETTARCLEILGEMDELAGARVLDLGTGTGVLAVAALVLGARRVVGVDIDPRAVAVAYANAELNGVVERLELVTGELDAAGEAGSFDVVLANIYGDVLLAVRDALVARARPGAKILLSGIAWEYDFEVRRRYEAAGCEVVRSVAGDDYCTVLLRKG